MILNNVSSQNAYKTQLDNAGLIEIRCGRLDNIQPEASMRSSIYPQLGVFILGHGTQKQIPQCYNDSAYTNRQQDQRNDETENINKPTDNSDTTDEK